MLAACMNYATKSMRTVLLETTLGYTCTYSNLEAVCTVEALVNGLLHDAKKVTPVNRNWSWPLMGMSKYKKWGFVKTAIRR